MSAINFVVRDVAGNISRGSVAGEGVPSSLIVGAGADVSLNLTRGQIVSYTRQGQALEITLIDGRTIVIEGYFTMEGVTENQLFLSADGFLTEVDLTAGAGADYYANYLEGDGAVGKFAVNDDLYFMRGADVMLADSFTPEDDQVGMLGAAIGGLAPIFGWGGAAAAGAAVVAGGLGGSGGGGSGPAAPVVDVTSGTEANEHSVNQDDHSDGVEIGGTGTAGATVVVTIDGATETTTVDENGDWEVTFDPADIAEGEYEVPVEVTITNEGGSTTVTDTLVVDTVIGVDMAAQGGDDGIINGVEFDGGITLSGTVTGGDSVVVTIDGTDYEAVVDGSSWSLDVSTSVMGEGEYSQLVTVTATDAVGNSSSMTSTIVVDTVTSVTLSTDGIGGSDGVINMQEHPNGLTLSGAAQNGATVVVTMGGESHTVTAEGGAWSSFFAFSEIPTGEDTLDVSVLSTDLAGNQDTASGSVVVDTFVNELTMTSNSAGGDDAVVNFNESGQSITMTGTVEVGSTVSVSLDGRVMPADVDPVTGDWTVTFPGGTLRGGDYDAELIVTATDLAGNSSTLNELVAVDTVVGDIALSSQPIEMDDVVNYDEASNGVIIKGTATPGLVVTVGFGDATMDVLAADGTWSANFPVSQVPADTDSALITASITDAAGNFKEVSDTVKIDTIVEPFNFSSEAIAGNNIINFDEAEDGIVFSGSVEPFSSVFVEFGGQSMTVSTGSNGQWSAKFSSDAVRIDEYTDTVTATATDQYQNTSLPITRSVEIDTHVNELTTTDPVEDNNVVNKVEASDGVTLNGTVEAGSVVVITYNYGSGKIVREADVDAQGGWSITYGADEFPMGTYTANITIGATDINGNYLEITDTFEVDTDAPDAPVIEFVGMGDDGVSQLGISGTDSEFFTINEIADNGSVTQLADQDSPNLSSFGTMSMATIDPELPNGSHLVVNETDGSDNSNATYVVMEEARTDVVDLNGLQDFNIGSIDLSFAKDSELTLDLAMIEGLSDLDNNLIIHGGDSDVITLQGGAEKTTETATIDGKSYDVYTMGDDAKIFIEDDIEKVFY